MQQVTLAKMIGISGAAVSKLENGRSGAPSAATLLKIAAVFEANPAWIMHGKGHPYEIDMKASASEMSDVFQKLSPAHQAAILAAAKTLL